MFFRRRKSEFRGHIDAVHDGAVCGWVQDRQHPKSRQIVDIYYEGDIIGSVCANLYREDLKLAGIQDGQYGFRYPLPENAVNLELLSVKVKGESFWLFNNLPLQILASGRESLINNTRLGLPLLRPGLSNYALKNIDIEISQEICRIWQDIKQTKSSQLSSDAGSMWAHIVGGRHTKLVSLLNNGYPEKLAAYLIKIHQYPESAGLYQGERAYQDFIVATPEGRRAAILPFHDMLASLSQYLGISPLECGEQGEEGKSIAQQSDEIIQNIEEYLGYEITFRNNYDGVYGINFKNNILHGRDIQALYLSLRQSEILQRKDATICEIGAGFGLSAYYAWLRGCDRYLIVDLPTVCLLQYFTLKKLLPNTNIEVVRAGQNIPSQPGVYIIPVDYAARIENLRADLIVNVDSFPEMGKNICETYFKVIPYWGALLLSINQEAGREITNEDNRQTIVSSMLNEAKYKRQYRFRSWIRQGYAEELWRCPSVEN